PFELVEFPETDGGAHIVVLAEYVTVEDGSGLVHQAPAFGEDDMRVCRAYGLPFVNPIRPDGTFEANVPLVGGEFFKTADAKLVADLQDRGLMFRVSDYLHSYPHCWRCHTALLYYAQPSWYIRTTQIKDKLLAQNEATNWHPESIKHGRYGDWLQNNIDWALSRSRYWGTPLPIWRNVEDETDLICIGSLAELGELAGRDLSELDPHRPFIDDVVIVRDGKTYHRVPEVIDAWFDSGAMPFAQWGYPHAEGSVETFKEHYPADFICEAIDQTRGWFYSLMAIGTLVFGQSSYKDVVCLGHILAEDGRKMSKHLGNILEPIPLMERHGADAVRWFMACSGSPWAGRRVGDATIGETVRKVLLTYWNTVAFQSLYARAGNWTPTGTPPPLEDRLVQDRWLASETAILVREVTAALESFDTQRAGVLLASAVDDLSNWYVRRARRRFWNADPSSLWTLHETLHTLTRLLAPIMPFVTERVWQDMFVPTDPDGPSSVHLADWPVADESVINADLSAAMRVTRRLVQLGRAARSESKIKVRQPLGRMLVPSAALASLTPALIDEVRGELNVNQLESFSSAGDLVEYSAKGNFRALGRRFGKQTPQVAAAIAATDASRLAEELAGTGATSVEFEGETLELGVDDVLITERPREGWSVVNEQGETVALDLELTPELLRAGLAREVIRFVQDARKNAGFDVSDRIVLELGADGELGAAIDEHASLIADEVLAVEFHRTAALVEATDVDEELGLSARIRKA
ncbi:MAG: class I tRNA ligase family protein, partial [Propionibacteriaceae bacterium]|nr:class I tRNA ligase family protein [Propionibacteriaceae bacterium]